MTDLDMMPLVPVRAQIGACQDDGILEEGLVAVDMVTAYLHR